jgi:hypothetical protein
MMMGLTNSSRGHWLHQPTILHHVCRYDTPSHLHYHYLHRYELHDLYYRHSDDLATDDHLVPTIRRPVLRSVGPVRWPGLERPDLLRLRHHLQVLQPVLLAVLVGCCCRSGEDSFFYPLRHGLEGQRSGGWIVAYENETSSSSAVVPPLLAVSLTYPSSHSFNLVL